MSRNNVTASPRHLLSLEAMRGLASLWVMVGHGLSWQPFAPRQWEGIPPWWKQWLFVWSPGHLGVVLFFLLSGYVIGKAYPSDRALLPGVYVLKRFIRIWPIFAVSILLGAPRIISNSQGRCAHEKAAEVAAKQENYISTIDGFVRTMGASPGGSCNNCYMG